MAGVTGASAQPPPKPQRDAKGRTKGTEQSQVCELRDSPHVVPLKLVHVQQQSKIRRFTTTTTTRTRAPGYAVQYTVRKLTRDDKKNALDCLTSVAAFEFIGIRVLLKKKVA